MPILGDGRGKVQGDVTLEDINAQSLTATTVTSDTVTTEQLVLSDGFIAARATIVGEGVLAKFSHETLFGITASDADGTPDVGWARSDDADGEAVLIFSTNGTAVDTWTQSQGERTKAANQTVTDSATLVNDTHLTVPVKAARVYRFVAELEFTTVNTSGVKVAIAGTATHTNIIYSVVIHGISTPGFLTSGRTTTAGTAVGVTASGTAARATIVGTTTVDAAGTLLVQFAQNAETGAAESVIALRGSSFSVVDVTP